MHMYEYIYIYIYTISCVCVCPKEKVKSHIFARVQGQHKMHPESLQVFLGQNIWPGIEIHIRLQVKRHPLQSCY